MARPPGSGNEFHVVIESPSTIGGEQSAHLQPCKGTHRTKTRQVVARWPSVSLYVDMESTVDDLYALRRAIAVIVHARHNFDDLTTADIVRLDAAVRHLSRSRKQMHGTLAASVDAFSTAPDPAGRSTVRAIDHLAESEAVNHTQPRRAPFSTRAELQRR